MNSQRRLTGVELAVAVVVVVVLLLAVVMFVMAIVTTFSPAVRHAENVTSSQAWTASLVSAVFATTIISGVNKHFDKRRR